MKKRKVFTFGPMRKKRVKKNYKIDFGYSVVLTDDITEQDIDYRRVSKYWFGRNIYSISNSYRVNFELKKGTVLMVSVGGDRAYIGGFYENDRFVCDVLGYGKMGFGLSDFHCKTENWFLDLGMNILIDDGKAKIVSYNRDEEFELSVYKNRVDSATCFELDSVEYDIIGMKKINNNKKLLYKIEYLKDRKKEEIFIKSEELVNFNFYTENGLLINSDIFDLEQPN